MPTLQLAAEESKVLMEFLDRYLDNLKNETARTDDRKFRKALKDEEDVIRKISGQLKAS